MAEDTADIPNDPPQPEEIQVAAETVSAHSAEVIKTLFTQTNSVGQMLSNTVHQIQVIRSLAAYAEDEQAASVLGTMEQHYASLLTFLQSSQQAIAAASQPQQTQPDQG